MMKKSSLLGIVGIVVVVGGVVFLSLSLSGNYLGSKREKTGIECQQIGTEHFVNIKDNKMEPKETRASLCDKLTVTNQDNKLRRIAFGEHDQHVAYNGVIEKILRQDQSFTVVLNESGTFTFHDHLQEETTATFIIK
jgi:hypothetical protein